MIKHSSEKALDGYEGFDFVLDNSSMDIDEANKALLDKLKEWGCLQAKVVA